MEDWTRGQISRRSLPKRKVGDISEDFAQMGIATMDEELKACGELLDKRTVTADTIMLALV